MGTVTIDSETEYQTWVGFEAVHDIGEHAARFKDYVQYYRDEVYQLAVSDFGLTRIRWEFWQVFGAYADANKLPNLDRLYDNWTNALQYFDAYARSVGVTPQYNFCFVGFLNDTDRIAPDLALDPDAYANCVLTAFQYLYNLSGLKPDYYEVILEPGNPRSANWTYARVGTNLVAACNLLAANGFTPKVIVPSTLSLAAAAYSYGPTIAATAGTLAYWKEISYHRYAGATAEDLAALVALANANALQTSMLEHIGADYIELHQDLTVGNVSAWQQYSLADPWQASSGSLYYILNADTVTPTVETWPLTNYLWQYSHYIRPGAVRLGATSDDAAHYDPVCFRNTTGKYVVVLKCTTGATEPLTISGLPAGEYGITYTDSDTGHKTLANQTIATGGTLVIDHTFTGPLTIYQLSNPGVTTMASIKYEAAAIANLMTTELNNLANTQGALGAEYDNGTNLYCFGLFELNATFGVAPTAGNLCNLYLIPAPDGTNYDDNTAGASPYAPQPCYVGGFPLQATTNAQKVPLGVTGYQALVPLPPCKFKAFLINNSGQAFPANGSTVKMIPYRTQVV